MAIFNQVPPSGGGGGAAMHTVRINAGQGYNGCGLYVPTTTPVNKGYSTSFVREDTSAQYKTGDLVLVFNDSDWEFAEARSFDDPTEKYVSATLGKYSGITLHAFVMPDNDVGLYFILD